MKHEWYYNDSTGIGELRWGETLYKVLWGEKAELFNFAEGEAQQMLLDTYFKEARTEAEQRKAAARRRQ